MATVAHPRLNSDRPDYLSGTPRAHTVDRWIYVFMAAMFVAVTLVGFIPDSLDKVAAVRAGARPAFPLVLHAHAVLMGSFLSLLLVQTWLAATGRIDWHRELGLLGMILAPALVVVGFILVPTMYRETWNALQTAAPDARADLQRVLSRRENILLLQTRIGLLFPLFLIVGLQARGKDAGLHKRMMILATAMALPASIDRIDWLPTTLPKYVLSTDLYMLLLVSPMFVWDLIRNRFVHRAYWIWLGINVPVALILYGLWNTPGWHAAARQVLGMAI